MAIFLPPVRSLNRRAFVRTMSLGAVALMTPGVFAEELTQTPKQTEGPFYPDKLPLDTDNDLLVINDKTTPALGEVSYLSGRILDAKGTPLKHATIEIWQCDNKGVYLHTRDSAGKQDKMDKNFQGFGRFMTGSNGEYLFRTIKPVPYPGRTPHIHVKVLHKGKHLLTTQCYIKGHEANERDGILRSVRDEKQRNALLVDYVPIKESKIGELAAKWDIVLGHTPEA